MKTDEKKDTLYLCDPQKNTECQKGICQMPCGCFLTTKKEFAVTDENKNPIIANDRAGRGDVNMKWIELNDGTLVNTEKLAGISANIKTYKVYYSFGTGDDMALETFGTAAAMERRMQQLKDLLLEK